MKQIQFKNMIGYSVMRVQDIDLGLLLNVCKQHKIPVWHIKQVEHRIYEFRTFIFHQRKIIDLLKESYVCTVVRRRGLFAVIIQLLRQQEKLLAILVGVGVFYILSHMVWQINITGVSYETEIKMKEILKEHGIYERGLQFSAPSHMTLESELQQRMEQLLYVAIDKKGMVYTIDSEEKKNEAEEGTLSTAQDLVAKKPGVIYKMFVKSGKPVVKVDDIVAVDDVLVAGEIETSNKKKKQLHANGKVYANTWYQVTLTGETSQFYDFTSGPMEEKSTLEIGSFSFPLQSFDSDTYWYDKSVTPLTLFSWELPVKKVTYRIYERQQIKQKYTPAEMTEILQQHVTKDLPLRLGHDAKILHYYTLHETVENGKVKLNLFVSVMEDIAKAKTIPQKK